MRDITERKYFEHEMLQAQKLEAIGRLAGGVAHDFNNILGVIQGYSEIAEEQIPETLPVLSQHVGEIRKAAYRGAGVTRQLLAFSRKQVMQLRPVKLTDAVKELEKMLFRLIGENIELVVRATDDIGIVNVDPVQIQQVLINLAINARDAMPNGGRLTITTGNVTLDSHYPRIHDPVVPGDYVLVTVSDTGIGMDQETVSHIFEPFFTTKGEGKGTGFGLSIVYGIVKQSGGYIWVYSEPGHGTTFKIYLPRIEDSEPKVVPIAPAAEASHKPATILLVEDEDALARMVATVLQASGYTVLYAATAERAHRIAQVYQEKIDLLLSDVILRGSTNGLELAKELSNIRPDMKLLFMSGYSDALNRADCNSNYLLLEKPFTNVELRRTVVEVLNGTAYTDAGFEAGVIHKKIVQ
jgi:nitrogen-specific signal transduction histidine kinase/CheY-like chemotaxis protein